MTEIRTPAEHSAALREIEYLWGSEPDSEEGQKLVEYLSAVDRYEELNQLEPAMSG